MHTTANILKYFFIIILKLYSLFLNKYLNKYIEKLLAKKLNIKYKARLNTLGIIYINPINIPFTLKVYIKLASEKPVIKLLLIRKNI